VCSSLSATQSIQATRDLPAHYNARRAEYGTHTSSYPTGVIDGKPNVRDGMKRAEDVAIAVFQK